MKVYVLSRSYEYEGLGSPVAVVTDESIAKRWADGGLNREYNELILDDMTGAES